MSKSWKSTLKLPSSSFPARPNPKLQQQYLNKCSNDLYAWQAENRSAEDAFILHDGPPYANGPLHIGHSLNKILKDMVIRTQLQKGKRVIYRPGWDCHGLPIEMKALGTSTGKGMSPAKIREQAKKLATKTVAEQMKGFQSFAVMSDWENKWTTMDADYESRQLRVFQELVRRGLIYRKHKPVYWSISSRTALAEAELEYRDDHKSTTAYVRYPIHDWSRWDFEWLDSLQGPLYAAIWTTTPWTLPANKAIAVHEKMQYCVLQMQGFGLIVASERLDHMLEFFPDAKVLQSFHGSFLAGLKYRNILQGGSLQPIVHADFVSADSGTGLVHMAPGHGQDDYEVCSKLGIEAFAPITDDGFFTKEAYPEDPQKLTGAPSILEGGSKAVLDIIEEHVLQLSTLQHKYPYDWRTKQPVVTRATAQWFADVGSLKKDALEALDKVKFVPESGRTRLKNFVSGRSEWCISRQRAWGVPIPALYNTEGNAVMTMETIEHIIGVMQKKGSQAWFSDAPDDPDWIPVTLSGTYRRGTDTMDVWFDSGSSWTETPSQVDVYLEGSDQHRGWFQSSLLTYVATQKQGELPPGSFLSSLMRRETGLAPFKTLITHGFTLDDQGKKMSKSIGNTISPQQVMDGTLLPLIKPRGKGQPRPDALGPDALRLWVASCDFTSDMSIGSNSLQPVHSSLIKYRTIIKMLTGSLHESSRQAPLTIVDKIALMQLKDTMRQVMECYSNYEFHRGTQIINRWISNDLSAFYLESLKDRLYCGDGGGVLEPIFIGFLRMLAPVTPILVEEAWDHRPQWMIDDGSIEHPARQLYTDDLSKQSLPDIDEAVLRKDWETMSLIRDAFKSASERAREDKLIGTSLQCHVIIESDNQGVLDRLKRFEDEMDAVLVVSSIGINAALPASPSWCYTQAFEGGNVQVLPPIQHKCSRCWRYLAESEEDNALCQRCDDVVGELSVNKN